MKFNLLVPITFLLFLYSCTDSDKKEEAKTNSTTQKYIVLTTKQLDLMDIELGEVDQQIITPIVYANGKIVPLPNSEASLSSNIAGKIDRIYVIEGAKVSKGQPIFTISGFEIIQIQQDYINNKNELRFLEQEYNRQVELRKNDVGALADLQNAEAKYYQSLGNLKSIKAKLMLLGLNTDNLDDSKNFSIVSNVTIGSPIDGYVLKLPVNIGMQVSPGVELAKIVGSSDFHAEVYCYERDINMIKEGQELELEFANKSMNKVKGYIQSISRSVDNENKSVILHVRFSSGGNSSILPYMSVVAKIQSRNSDEKVTTVPITAIYEESKISYLFHTIHAAKTDKDPNLYFKKLKVDVLSNDGSNAEIRLSGDLPPDSKIVIHNTFALEVESRKLGSE